MRKSFLAGVFLVAALCFSLYLAAQQALPQALPAEGTKGVAPLAALHQATARVAPTYAVVVGISDYPDEHIPDLKHPHIIVATTREVLIFITSPGTGM